MIENTTDDRQAKRCGHNFPIAECPYAFCEAKEIALKLEASERRCETLEKQRSELCSLVEKMDIENSRLSYQLAAKQPAASEIAEIVKRLREMISKESFYWSEVCLLMTRAANALEASRAGEGKADG